MTSMTELRQAMILFFRVIVCAAFLPDDGRTALILRAQGPLLRPSPPTERGSEVRLERRSRSQSCHHESLSLSRGGRRSHQIRVHRQERRKHLCSCRHLQGNLRKQRQGNPPHPWQGALRNLPGNISRNPSPAGTPGHHGRSRTDGTRHRKGKR